MIFKKLLMMCVLFPIVAVPGINEDVVEHTNTVLQMPLDVRIQGVEILLNDFVKKYVEKWKEFQKKFTHETRLDPELVELYYVYPNFHPIPQDLYSDFSWQLDSMIATIPQFIPDAPEIIKNDLISQIEFQRMNMQALMKL